MELRSAQAPFFCWGVLLHQGEETAEAGAAALTAVLGAHPAMGTIGWALCRQSQLPVLWQSHVENFSGTSLGVTVMSIRQLVEEVIQCYLTLEMVLFCFSCFPYTLYLSLVITLTPLLYRPGFFYWTIEYAYPF